MQNFFWGLLVLAFIIDILKKSKLEDTNNNQNNKTYQLTLENNSSNYHY